MPCLYKDTIRAKFPDADFQGAGPEGFIRCMTNGTCFLVPDPKNFPEEIKQDMAGEVLEVFGSFAEY